MGDREPRPLTPPAGLRLHNTLTGRDDAFPSTSSNGDLLIYVCGITPYDDCHLGHARCYITFDVLRRHLRFLGHRVRFVQNFTDIDDKIIARAAELKIAPAEVAARYSADYFGGRDRLNVERADLYPKVTESIPDVIRLIERLVAAGLAYPSGGDVWFAVRKFPGYGKLSHRKLEDLQSGARVEPSEAKRDPLDFALWKAAKPGEPSWESPWGAGRPGWHIECSAMAMRHLGETIDLHGGGQDLIFPHHENEIAQSEGATGRPFARHWAHNGFVNISGEKMAKSLGNFVTLRELCEREEPDVIRYLLISHHYRGPLDYTPEKLAEARKGWERIVRTLDHFRFLRESLSRRGGVLAARRGETSKALELFIAGAKRSFLAAMNADLNTAGALAELHAVDRALNEALNAPDPNPAAVDLLEETLLDQASVLGLKFRVGAASSPPALDDAAGITRLVHARDAARARRDWAESDRLRADLATRGIVLEDSSLGTRWRRKA